ncbi:MAG TPA: Spy/CpxP family protein refolding chaperone, partial [Xanthobacteraceae bacterium]|nr:Spy/CpxP family protein refolding chaperone [Xanthobacteraceae bacterium]
MKKSILAATTAVILAGSAATYAVAQQQPAPTKTAMEDHWRPSAADREAFAAARVAALHAGLALTPEQEQLWPPVESVLKDMAKKREARMAEHRAERRMDRDRKEPANAIDRLRRGAERMTDIGNDLKRLADAAQPLYDKLDDGQKRRLQKMVR